MGFTQYFNGLPVRAPWPITFNPPRGSFIIMLTALDAIANAHARRGPLPPSEGRVDGLFELWK